MTNQPKFGEWIKCSEQAPKVGSTVLYYAKNGEPVVAYIGESDEFGGVYYELVTDGNVDGIDWGVSKGEIGEKDCWMPLPEAPNE